MNYYMDLLILTINPGSTSTKIAAFDGDKELLTQTIRHSTEDMSAFPDVQSQYDYRKELIRKTVEEHGIALGDIKVFIGRGGGLKPVPGGVYEINEAMLSDCRAGTGGAHPAQLAPQICAEFAKTYGGIALVADPPTTDEFDDISRLTGLRNVFRRSSLHALNQKEAARRFCDANGLEYERVNLIVAHLGGGISVAAHRKGAMVDGNDNMRGSGPFSPTRSGDLPYLDVLDLARKSDIDALSRRLNVNGGMTDIFGTADMIALENEAATDGKVALRIDAMAYQTAKYISAMAAALYGDVKQIIITGALARSALITNAITERVQWICPVTVIAGEFENEALARSALRVLRGVETVKEYR